MKPISKIILFLTIIIFTNSSCQEKTDEFERSYTKSIERISSNEFENELIDAAEKYYPPRDSVVKVTYGMEIPYSKYWYYDVFDGVNIPYAITEDAINYYSNLIDELNENKKDNFFLAADLNYKAEVSFYESYTSPSLNSRGETVESEEFNSVYVVKMILKWEDYCGSLCALWINKERVVVFNETGDLLKVFLDGAAPTAVS